MFIGGWKMFSVCCNRAISDYSSSLSSHKCIHYVLFSWQTFAIEIMLGPETYERKPILSMYMYPQLVLLHYITAKPQPKNKL
jgi:hypothetical protein